jgi:hypothetical protein
MIANGVNWRDVDSISCPHGATQRRGYNFKSPMFLRYSAILSIKKSIALKKKKNF